VIMFNYPIEYLNMKFHTKIQKQLCNASVCSESKIKAYRKHLRSKNNIAQIALFSKLTSDPNRNNIIYLLYKFHAFCVCDLANILGVSIASVSQHLRKLHDKGLVKTRKEKQTIYYALNDKNFISYLKCLYEKI